MHRRLLLAPLLTTLALCCNIEKLTADATSKSVLAGSIALDRESDTQFARDIAAMPCPLPGLRLQLMIDMNGAHAQVRSASHGTREHGEKNGRVEPAAESDAQFATGRRGHARAQAGNHGIRRERHVIADDPLHS